VSRAAEAAVAAEGRTSVRVRYAETDRMNVVYHTHYLVWFEVGRTELMRALGCDYASLEDGQRIYFPLREIGARYRAPARYDDLLDVHTTLMSVGGASVRFEYRVTRQGEDRVLVHGFTEHAAVDTAGRPCRLPAEVRRKLTSGVARR
jgi:acyl-CoA thioester hydrolase